MTAPFHRHVYAVVTEQARAIVWHRPEIMASLYPALPADVWVSKVLFNDSMLFHLVDNDLED